MNSNKSKPALFSKEIKQEIMATDIFIGVIHESNELDLIEKDVNNCFSMLRIFEKNFSRFIKNNELQIFNASQGQLKITEDLYEMLEIAVKYYRITGGIFDISILPYLLKEGYVTSSTKGYLGEITADYTRYESFSSLQLLENGYVDKPQNLIVDLGGIGKGFVIEKIAKFLSERYENFIIDAGGDIYCHGRDTVNGYDHWALDVENPFNKSGSIETLTLNNMAVATSGIDRRKWLFDNEEKNHLIDPKTKKSISNNLISVTSISSSIIDADIMAKTLLIMGLDLGLKYSENHNIASLFIRDSKEVVKSSIMSKYVWKA